MEFALCETKLGWVGVGIEDGKICAATVSSSREAAGEAMADRGAAEPADGSGAASLLDLMRRAAEGEDVAVKDVVQPVGGTPFQRAVWQEMMSIPRGTTISYGELARRVGKPGAARAVGQAVGRNPVAVLIPCHRVIGSDGGLHGFGGGLPLKRALLRQEGVRI